jgi:hypothetical protein
MTTCRTPEQAFAAGWNESCDHGTDPGECPTCRLSDTEITRIAVLLAGLATANPVPEAA